MGLSPEPMEAALILGSAKTELSRRTYGLCRRIVRYLENPHTRCRLCRRVSE